MSAPQQTKARAAPRRAVRCAEREGLARLVESSGPRSAFSGFSSPEPSALAGAAPDAPAAHESHPPRRAPPLPDAQDQASVPAPSANQGTAPALATQQVRRILAEIA